MNRRRTTSAAFRGAAIALAGIAAAPLLGNAVLVAPHAIFIDHRTRTAQVTLANPGAEPEEVDLAFAFGFPATDSAGQPYVRLFDEPADSFPSAAGWIRAFPRRVRLEPGQRQVVRLLATPPADLADGEYWTRLIVTSKRGQEVAVTDTTMRAGLTLELRTIVSLTYRKGDVRTGVAIDAFDARVVGDSLVARLAVHREGNGAYLGVARFAVMGREAAMHEWAVPIAVYYDMDRRFAFPLTDVPPGSYELRFDLTTEREDIPLEHVLPAPPITRRQQIEVG